MSKKVLTGMVATLAVVTLTVWGTSAFAGQGRGKGNCPFSGAPVNTAAVTGSPAGCPLATANLSEEQIQQLAAERKAFFDATAPLKESIFDKKVEMRKELIVETPDVEKAKALQREISELNNQIFDLWISHMLRMKAINPDMIQNCPKFGMGGGGCMMGMGGGGPMGGMGRGQGRGFHGGGHGGCW